MSFSFGSTGNQTGVFGAASKPNFSFGSANTATTSTAGFAGFGTSTTSTGLGFGAPTSTAFGMSAPATTTPSLFGAGGFGTQASKPAVGFGNTSFGSFGTSTATAAPFGTAPAFGTTLGGTNFGSGTSYGANFGAKPSTTGFGGFGTGLGTTNTFGQLQPQQGQQPQQQPGPASAQEALVAAVFNCNVFGDERDQVLAKWNLLQAQWGVGQAYYSRNAPPLELNEQNPLCRFKAVGYSKLSGRGDSEGLVTLVFNKSEQEIKTNQQALVTSLSGLLGNKPNLAVNIDSVKSVSETKTQVVIFVVDNNAGGTRISASELGAFLNGQGRASLTAAGCLNVTPNVRPSPQALAQYLQTPPPGMDIRMWKQAQIDNPDPENYVPVPMIGISELKYRSKCQSEQAALQASFLKKASEEVAELRARRSASAAKLAQLAARHHSLRHTLLQVIARQEMNGRVGAALMPEEEATRARLQELASQLAAPPFHSGRLNELLCAVRLQRSASAGSSQERYLLDPGAQEDLKQFLTLQQKGMAHLLDTARKDLAALNTIAEGMSRLVQA